MTVQKMYIDGKLISSEKIESIINPATDNEIVKIYIADNNLADMALISANKAKNTWGRLSVDDRIYWMDKLRNSFIENEEKLRLCVYQETGKTWNDTKEDFQLLIDSLDFYSKESKQYLAEETSTDETHKHILKKQGMGVCVAYLAWNFPLLNLGYKLGPAMATGCPIIIKPSIKTPLSAYLVGTICDSINLPPGAVNIIAGNDIELGNYLSSSKIPSILTLIGSTQTGKNVIKSGSSSIKNYSMELGGDAPYIVFNDADLELSADILTAIKFGNTGQICVSANRVFVEESVAEQFIGKVLERVSRIKLGWGRDSGATMGSLIDKGARDRIHSLVCDAKTKGATCLVGGKFDEKESGAFYPATVLTGITDDMLIYKTEIFGPVISICTFNCIDDVIKRANDTDSGLASYVFTTDLEKSNMFCEKLEFGEIHVNGIKYGINLPHTGIKQSGVGCDCSLYALDDYVVIKRISIAL
ncbi:aldehyde dehydrogenase family protein [Vibrio artabrorum]|uniref:aldehyde dehydrogenase family protein n=1 Tax=Vibrio artabrorum TaxID=446374 RepID=UPI00354EC972